MAWDTQWTFCTRNIEVAFQVSECLENPREQFSDDADVEAIESGSIAWFDARVLVILRDPEARGMRLLLGSDVLGACAYESVRDFYVEHRNVDPMKRNCSVRRAIEGEHTHVAYYFPDMVRAAVTEARKRLHAIQDLRVR